MLQKYYFNYIFFYGKKRGISRPHVPPVRQVIGTGPSFADSASPICESRSAGSLLRTRFPGGSGKPQTNKREVSPRLDRFSAGKRRRKIDLPFPPRPAEKMESRHCRPYQHGGDDGLPYLQVFRKRYERMPCSARRTAGAG